MELLHKVAIKRTHDMQFVKEVMTHPRIWKWISDDGCSVETFDPVDSDKLYWLTPVGESRMGVFFVHPHNTVTYEIHTAILPEYWGNGSDLAAIEVLKWIFSNTPCQKLITHVPQNNPFALRFAKFAGLQIEGINRKSFMKNGQLLDQYLLGISKEAICQQPQ